MSGYYEVDPDTGMTHQEMLDGAEMVNEARAYREDVEAGVFRIPYLLPQETAMGGPYCTAHEGPGGRLCPIHTDGSCMAAPVQRMPQFADPDAVIGHSVPHPSGKGYGILCLPCILTIRETHPCFEPAGAAVYGININPYKVVCVHCEKVVVEGCGVELYDGK